MVPARYFDGVDHYQKKATNAIKEISYTYTESQKNISSTYRQITPDF
jgi:hypothetical protein